MIRAMDSHHPPRQIDTIVEEQVRRWQLQRDAAQQPAESPEEPWPLITVSREFGALGAHIAKRVASRLGWDYWDRELVNAVAERTGAREALIASLDEHVRSRIDEFIAHIFTGVSGTESEYVRQVGRVLHTVQRHGAAVVVGRGSQFVVKPEQALRVRIVCPHDERVAGHAKRQNLDEARAQQTVDRVENERRAFLRKHYGKDVTEPTHYDIVVNTGGLSVEGTGEVIIAAYGAKFGRVPETQTP